MRVAPNANSWHYYSMLTVCKSTLSGDITPPPSKSQSMRAILFASMASGTSRLGNLLDSPDVLAMINACRQIGAVIERDGNNLLVQGVNGKPNAANDVIDAGNSGQVLRFIAAISALSSHYTVITGDHSIRTNRPLQPLIDGLNQLDCFCVATKEDGFAPVIVKGPLQGGSCSIDGSDSQPVSGLLMAAAFAPNETTLRVSNPGEKPWVELTLHWFDKFGIKYQNENFENYTVAGNQQIDGFDYTVASDFSSMAYPIAAALITKSSLTINHVDMQDAQGDKQLIDVLIKMGADIQYRDNTLVVNGDCDLNGIKVNINDFIDSVTILAVIACFAKGRTTITGASIARSKECNRLQAICTELTKMGANIHETEDGLIIEESSLTAATVDSYNDHRMVLSLAVASLALSQKTTITNTKCINKSYPGFVKDMRALGCNIEVHS